MRDGRLNVMKQEMTIDAGGVQLRVENREIGEDGGPAVCVYAAVDGTDIQVLRFDCFRKDPHYHFDPAGTNDKRDLDPDSVPDPVSWTLDQLGNHLEELIREAGFETAAMKVDQAGVAEVLPQVESIMRGKAL